MRTKTLRFDDSLEFEYTSLTNGDTNERKRTRALKILNAAINNELTGRQKTCIMRYYYDGIKVNEIAQELNIKPTTVYKHLKTARTALKKCRVYL